MKRSVVIAGVLAGVVLTASLAQAKVIYVDDDAVPGGDGSSWTTAYRFLQDGLAAAKTAGGEIEIRVAQGVYKPDRSTAHPDGNRDRAASFELKDGMTLKGGYAGLTGTDPNVWDNALYRTVLSGDLANNDMTVQGIDPCDLFKVSSDRNNMWINCTESTLSENSYHVVTVTGEGTLKGCEVMAGQGSDPRIKIPLYTAAPVIVPEFCGAGLYTRSGKIVVEDCTFRGNYSPHYGGGMCVRSGEVRIVQCRFEGNIGWSSGGGLYLDRGRVELVAGDFKGNKSSMGGGASIYSSEAMVKGCSFVENAVSSFGGGINIGCEMQVVMVDRCLFLDNQSGNGGGGCFSSKGIIELVGCQFVNNSAKWQGGALVGEGVRILHCMIVGNKAVYSGGAIASQGKLDIVNCTAVGNRARDGRFLMGQNSPSNDNHIYITNSIIWDGANEIRNPFSAIEIRYTDIQGGVASAYDPWHGLVLGPGNTDIDPYFALPGYWDPNGSPDDPNDDFWVEGNYYLKSQAGRYDPVSQSWVVDDVTSPCIDAGDPYTPIGLEPFPNGGRINMGAYGGTAEASKSYFGRHSCETIVAGDINGDCRVDAQDLAALASHWLESR